MAVSSTITLTQAEEYWANPRLRPQVEKVLTARAKRDTPSGHRAARFLRTHGVTPEARETAAQEAQVAQAKAPKKPRTKAEKAATQARSKAFTHMLAERAAGRKCTYGEACAKFGTVPATKKG
jgi:3'-phosphoadenosine 5'-phosphosulfate (PAPS) 3'-phosphatase